MMIAGLLIVLLLTFAIRSYWFFYHKRPVWAGWPDTYFHFKCADLIRREGTRNALNDQFHFKGKCDYPPGFHIMLSLLPEGVLYRIYPFINPLIESLFNGILFMVLFLRTQRIEISALGCLFYIYVFSLQNQSKSLNPRILGHVLLALYILRYYYYLNYDHPLYAVIVMLTGILLLYTNRMSYPVMFLLPPILFFFIGDTRIIALYAASMVSLLLISPSRAFYSIKTYFILTSQAMRYVKRYGREAYGCNFWKIYGETDGKDKGLTRQRSSFPGRMIYKESFYWYITQAVTLAIIYFHHVHIERFLLVWYLFSVCLFIATRNINLLGQNVAEADVFYLISSMVPTILVISFYLTPALSFPLFLFYALFPAALKRRSFYFWSPVMNKNYRDILLEMDSLEKGSVLTLPQCPPYEVIFFTKHRLVQEMDKTQWLVKRDFFSPYLKEDLETCARKHGFRYILGSIHNIPRSVREKMDKYACCRNEEFILYDVF